MAFQGDSIFWVEVEKIVPNPFQPRREFDEAKLKELAESVRMYGILQPMTVTRREVPNDDGSFRTEYELIAGERRLRASKLAGVSQVPVIIRDGEQSEQEKLELAIIENLQREDLNAVDRALAFRQLADVFNLSHAQVAKKVGRSREYVSNSIRILALPDYMLDAVRTNDISEGHARTLLMLNDRPEEQDTVFRETMLKKLSVREVERIARGIATEKVRKKETIDSDLLDLEKQFTETLGTRVSIVKTEFGGRLTIDYFSPDELQVMLTRMRDEQAAELKTETAAATVATLADSTPLQATPEIATAPDTQSTAVSVATPTPESGPEAHTTHNITADATPEPAKKITPNFAHVPTESAVTPSEESTVAATAAVVPETPDEPVVNPSEAVPSVPNDVTKIPPESETVVSTTTANDATTRTTPTENAIPEQTPAATAAPLSLRDQLALMLQKKPTTPDVPATMTPATTPTPQATPRSETPAPVSAPPVVPTPAPTPREDDDSDLYSMKNFTV